MDLSKCSQGKELPSVSYLMSFLVMLNRIQGNTICNVFSSTVKLSVPRAVSHTIKSTSSCFFFCLLVTFFKGLWCSIASLLIVLHWMVQPLCSTVLHQSVFLRIMLGDLAPFFKMYDKVWQVHCFNDMTTCSIKIKSRLSDVKKHLVTAILPTIQNVQCSWVNCTLCRYML